MSLENEIENQRRIDRRHRSIWISIAVFVLELALVCGLTFAFPVVGKPYVNKGMLEPASDELANLAWKQNEISSAGGVTDEVSPSSLYVARVHLGYEVYILDTSSEQVLANLEPNFSLSQVDVTWIDEETLAVQIITPQFGSVPARTDYYFWYWRKINIRTWTFTALLIIGMITLPILIGTISYRIGSRKR